MDLTEQILIDNGFKRVMTGIFPFDGSMLAYENAADDVVFVYDPNLKGKNEWWCMLEDTINEDDFIDIDIDKFNEYLTTYSKPILKY